MRLHILKLFLLFVFCLAFVRVKAQVNGSFGDPVIDINFGSGPNPGPSFAYTTMLYTSGCPNDGSYTIASNNSNGTNCHPGTWQNVLHDHTYYTNGDPNGYMMIINATDPIEGGVSGQFYEQHITSGLCANTKYQFSAYFLNLITVAAGGVGVEKPNIKFTIVDSDGNLIQDYSTGEIEPSISGGKDGWVPKGFTFTTDNNPSIILRMENIGYGGNGNDLILDDIQFSAYGPKVTTAFLSTTPTSFCFGPEQKYTLQADPVIGYSNVSLQWQADMNNGQGWVDLPGQTTYTYKADIPANSPAGDYKYRLAAAEGGNINSLNCRVYSDARIVTVNDLPVVADIPPSSACEDDPHTITASGGVSYEWEGPGITAANKNQNPLIFSAVTSADAGTYKVTVTSAGGCTASTTTTLTVNKKPVIQGDFSPVPICVGASTQLNASTPGNVTYSWTPTTGLSDPTIANPIATPADTTVYTVKVSSNFDCFDTKSVTVNVLPPPIADAGKKKKIFEGQSVTLDATAKNGDIYSWSPTEYLSDPTALNPVATPTDDIKYTLTVTSSYNCGMDTSSVFVRVFKKIIIPNTFSPNADGVNDAWQIEALETYPQSLLTIFNRYGQQVFKSIGYSKPWKGTYNGKVLPPGTYYYIIDLKNDTPKLTGWVLLVQ